MLAGVVAVSVSCRNGASAARELPAATLRIGVSTGVLSLTNANTGIRQIIQNATTEGLARVAPDGRMEPQLAERWSFSADGRSLRLDLKPNLRFSDGSPLDAKALAAGLATELREYGGPEVTEGVSVKAASATAIEINLPRAEPLFIESLEVPIRKPGSAAISTGAFFPIPGEPTHLRASDTYYLGRPPIAAIDIRTFRSLRMAWAELLRSNIDMLYEVSTDALDSLESSTRVSVFRFIRPYQYTLVLNNSVPALQAAAVRQALNLAVDREQLVRVALNGHGIPSSGPLRMHWLLDAQPIIPYQPQEAARILAKAHLRFTCLLPLDPIYERLALELTRQLAAVGVEMTTVPLPPDQLVQAQTSRHYDAVLTETISGPSLLRLYLVWHSNSGVNFGRGNETIDAALDAVRAATDESSYRRSVVRMHHAFAEDPPAVFLAWSERARAVSNRFTVPRPEAGRDVLSTLFLWKPSNDQRLASRN